MDKLIDLLQAKQVTLFLGQSSFLEYSDSDFTLKALEQLYNCNLDGDYKEIQKYAQKDDVDEKYFRSQLHRISGKIGLSEILGSTLDFSWNHIYTTRFDNLIEKHYQLGGRNFTPILSSSNNVGLGYSRSQHKLNISYLYGSIFLDTSINPEISAPLKRLQIRRRSNQVSIFLRRLREIVGPVGLLFIDGYNPKTDWLSVDNLLDSLSYFKNKQVHIFGYSNELLNNDDVKDYVDSGIITLHEFTLESFFHNLKETNPDSYTKLGSQDLERTFKVKNKSYQIPNDLWNDTRKNFLLMNQYLFENDNFPEIFTTEKEKFNHFLLNSKIIPIWSGFKYDFAFSRSFVDKIYNVISTLDEDDKKASRCIVVRGQGGSGKTIGLGELIYKIISRANNKSVVLFKEKSYISWTGEASNALIDFYDYVSGIQSDRLILVYDGMEKPEFYKSLFKKMQSRGKSITLIGTSYEYGRLEEKKQKSNSFSEIIDLVVDIELDDDEKLRFKDYFETHISAINNFDLDIVSKKKNFLELLYRLLPYSKLNIQDALGKETDMTIEHIVEIVQNDDDPEREKLGNFIFRDLLSELSIELTEEESSREETVELIHNDVDLVEQGSHKIINFINTVMVVGSFGLDIPFELLLRSSTNEYLFNFPTHFFTLSTYLRWNEDSQGNITISPRTDLEASLILQRSLRSVKDKEEIIVSILKNLTSDNYHINQGIEVDFVIKLMKLIKGREVYYSALYNFGKTLSYIRERDLNPVENPRLILQEASLLQESFKYLERFSTEYPGLTKLRILNEALYSANIGLTLYENDETYYSKDDYTYSYLKVEKASILMSMAHESIDSPSEEKIKYLGMARDLIKKQSLSSWTGYHAADVYLNSLRVEIGIENTDESKVDLMANFIDFIQKIEDSGISDLDLERHNSRKLQLSKDLDLVKLSEATFNKLEIMGSKAGYYLRAIELCGGFELLNKSTYTNDDKIHLRKAHDYLQKKSVNIQNDIKCLYLELKLFFAFQLGEKLYAQEKQSPNLDINNWSYVGQLCQRIKNSGDNVFDNVLYLQGVANGHLNLIPEMFSSFRELATITNDSFVGKNRVRKFLVHSDENGVAKKFSGYLKYPLNSVNRSSQILVSDWNKLIEIRWSYEDGWYNSNYDKNEFIEFYIAYNYIGPIAIRQIQNKK